MECLNDMLVRNARNIGDKTYLITDEESVTYAQFDARTSRLAHVLAARGVKKGDRVGLYLPSKLIMVYGFWACQKLGAIAVPMSAMYREGEISNILKSTGMSAIVTDDETYPLLAKVRGNFPTLKIVLTDGTSQAGETPLAELMAKAPEQVPHVPCMLSDIACMFFTSGTTGIPKGTVQTHKAICSSARDMMAFHRTQFGKEIYYCAAPLFNNLGMNVTVNFTMYTGGTVVVHDRWITRRVLDSIKKHRITFLPGTPTMFVYMLNEFDPKTDDLTSLRVCTNGGSPVSPVIAKKFEDASGCKVIQVYGATESLGQSVMEPVVGVRKTGSAGVAVGSARIEILDDNGAPVPNGTVGEVVIGGDTLASGYWNEPEISAKTFTPKGWMSGDLGYLDEDGYLFIVDRKKDVIISGGNNIYPLEVENILYQHPDVGVCVVLGIPDEAKGEIPVAVVVPKVGRTVDGKAVIAFCKENVSAYKAPRQIYLIDVMPEGGAGKILKNQIAARIKSGELKPAA